MIYNYIFESAGILRLDPKPWTLFELFTMRQAAEKESWDRLAFQLTNQAAFAGAKRPKFEDFHKFYQHNRGLTVAKLKSMKSMFKGQT